MTGALGLYARLAARNLWRQRRRNALLLVAVALGVGVIIIGNAFIRGWQQASVLEAVDRMGGTVLARDAAWIDEPSAAHAFAVAPEVLAGLPGSVRTRVVVPVSVQSEREVRGGALYGIDPGAEQAHLLQELVVVEGRALADVDDPGLLIGRALARQLETGVGRRVVLIGQDAAGRRSERGLRVVGIFAVSAQSMEQGQLLTGRATAQAFAGLGDRVTHLAVDGGDPFAVAATLAAVEAALPDLRVEDWAAVAPAAAAIHAFMGAFVGWLQVIFLAALSFGVVNTLVIAVYERTREFGLLQAVGMTPRGILVQVVFEAWVVLGTGVLFGLLVGFVGWWLMRGGVDMATLMAGYEVPGSMGRLYPDVQAGDLVSLLGVVLVLGIAAALYPASRAVKMDPVQALNARGG